MERSTLSFAAILLFGVIAAIFIVRKGNEAADELQRLNNGAFGIHRIALAEELNTETSDTSNWKTYRNEKYGFEVRYPGDWLGKKYKSLCGDDEFSKSFSKSVCTEQVVELANPLADSAWYKVEKRSCAGADIPKWYMSGDEAFQRKGLCSNGLVITLEVINQNSLKDHYKLILDEILSTFKFIK